MPLSFAQQQLWLLSRLQPDSPAYNIPIVYRLVGSLKRTALDKSLNEIVQRHETLRTSCAVAGEQPVQVIAPTLRLALPSADLRESSETKRETESQRLAAAEARRPFNLMRGPLVRSILLQLGDRDHVFAQSNVWQISALYYVSFPGLPIQPIPPAWSACLSALPAQAGGQPR